MLSKTISKSVPAYRIFEANCIRPPGIKFESN
jgi:hypothetical protein